MARIKLGPVVTAIAGSVGGATFQRNHFGITMRSKPLPRDPFSSSQYVIRQYMQSVQIAWQDLTVPVRLQWNRFLDFSGQTVNNDKSVKLSGHSLFLKYQMIRLISGRSILDTFAYIPMPTVSVFVQFTSEVGPHLTVKLDPFVDVSEYFFLIRVSTPRNPNRAFSSSGLRAMPAVYGDATDFLLTTPYIAAFGFIPAVGTTLHYSLQFYSYRDPIFSGITSGIAECQA